MLQTVTKQVELKGGHSVSLRTLGKALDISHTSIWRHFADKRALLDAVAERGFKDLGNSLHRVLKRRGQDFDANLLDVIRTHAKFAMRQPGLYRWMLEAAGHHDAPLALRDARNKVFWAAAIIFEEGQAAGAVVAADPAGLSYISFMFGQSVLQTRSGTSSASTSITDITAEVVDLVKLGLLRRS